MGTVCGGKCVVDVKISEFGKLRGKFRIVALLAGVKPGVLQNKNVAIGKAGNRINCIASNCRKAKID